MTDFDKVKNYYKGFDEKNRLINDNSGKLEYYMTMKILEEYLPSDGTILDLGGGAGVYSFPLAKKGYNVYLSDLSEDLINQALEQKEEEKVVKDSLDSKFDIKRQDKSNVFMKRYEFIHTTIIEKNLYSEYKIYLNDKEFLLIK